MPRQATEQTPDNNMVIQDNKVMTFNHQTNKNNKRKGINYHELQNDITTYNRVIAMR